MNLFQRITLISILCLVSVGCDQATKSLAAEHLPRGHMLSYWQDTLRIGYTENSGAFLSMGSTLAPEIRFWVFVVASGALLAALAAYMVVSKSLTRTSLIGFSLLLSGGLSNVYDRITNNGAVIDFINLGIGPIRTGVFNIADVAIMAGFVILIFHRPRARATAASDH